MAVSESDFRQAMADVTNQMQMMERALNARIALAESEVLRLRSRGDDSAKSGKSGILDYPIKLTDMGRWRPWTERVVRWAKMQSPELAAALTAALKARDLPVVHSWVEESNYFWAHLEDWLRLTSAEALGIVKHVREDDGVEVFRQLNCRYPR